MAQKTFCDFCDKECVMTHYPAEFNGNAIVDGSLTLVVQRYSKEREDRSNNLMSGWVHLDICDDCKRKMFATVGK